MIKDFWKSVTLVCGCHEKPVKMMIQSGPSSMFYSCPKYYPNNRQAGETACANRITLLDYEEMLKILETQMESNDGFEIMNLAGFKFINLKKTIEFYVIKHENNEIVVSMKNLKALK